MRPGLGSGRREFLHRDHVAQFLDPGLEQPSHRHGFGDRNERDRTRASEDPHVTPQVLLQLRGACRRIDRHRNTARQHYPEEAVEILAAGGQHDGHGLTRLEPPGEEPSGHFPGAIVEILVGDLAGPVLLLVELDVGPLPAGAHIELEDLDEAPGASRDRLRSRRRFELQLGLGLRPLHSAGSQYCPQEIARCLRQQCLVWQAQVEGSPQPQHQLGAGERV